MRSRVLTWLFAVLLLAMQHGVQLHALSHLGGLLDRPQEQGLQLPANDTSCLICTLSAGGSNAIAAHGASAPTAATATAVIWATVTSPSLSAPAYYSSRAPPTLL
jgi:hypothetical protein